MNTLLEAIGSADQVALSRLADESTCAAIADAGIDIVEVPHMACRPLVDETTASLRRVRHWPNVGGFLEQGKRNDIVAWSPLLAARPVQGSVVPIGSPPFEDLPLRTRFLDWLTRRLEQHRGVTRSLRPGTARTIVYTPGVTEDLLSQMADQFPGAVACVPTRLREFPGGLILTVTSEVWQDPDTFVESLDHVLTSPRTLAAPIGGRRT